MFRWKGTRVRSRRKDARRTPSLSEDFTFARMTSDAKGLNTTSLNKTTRPRGGGGGLRHPSQLCDPRTRKKRTFVPQQPITIPHLPLPDFCEVEHAYAEADVVQDAVGVLFVELVGDGLVGRDPKVGRVYRDRVLSAGSARFSLHKRWTHLDDGELEHGCTPRTTTMTTSKGRANQNGRHYLIHPRDHQFSIRLAFWCRATPPHVLPSLRSLQFAAEGQRPGPSTHSAASTKDSFLRTDPRATLKRSLLGTPPMSNLNDSGATAAVKQPAQSWVHFVAGGYVI